MQRVLCLGDVVGKPGVQAVTRLLPGLRQALAVDLIICNAENADDGSGLSPVQAQALLAAGCDVLTNGDHTWRKEGVLRCLEHERVIRPANFHRHSPGRGWTVCTSATGVRLGVINVLGQIFLCPCDSPFAALELALADLAGKADLIVVDLHAEATSEKYAVARFLDGKVAAIFGTHTHVPTADAAVLPGGTGYVTDVGMCGPHNGVIGRKAEAVVAAMQSGMFQRYHVATGDVRLNGVLFTLDPATGHCVDVQMVRRDLP